MKLNLVCLALVLSYLNVKHHVLGFVSSSFHQHDAAKTTNAMRIQFATPQEDNLPDPLEKVDEESTIARATVKIDDGGSNLTDRFKYKVNALMGVFDPSDQSKDNERSDGNILGALVTFPADHTFTVIGRTKGDSQLRDSFVEQVQAVVGGSDTQVQVTERGSKFTKVTVTSRMETASLVTEIYIRLSELELSVMQF